MRLKEKMSGAISDRPQLHRLLKLLDEGDVLLVTRLDRLARSTCDLLNTPGAGTGKEDAFPVPRRQLGRHHDPAWPVDTYRSGWSCGVRARGDMRPAWRRSGESQKAGREARAEIQADTAPAERGPCPQGQRRNPDGHRPQLQCQPQHHIEAIRMTLGTATFSTPSGTPPAIRQDSSGSGSKRR
jgi:hypothetical protein